MKKITPINIWINGKLEEASILEANIVYDDLKTSCTFYYQLKEMNVTTPSEIEGDETITTYGYRLAEGNIYMSGSDYNSWDGSNDAAYVFVANRLNLTLLPE